MSEQGQVCYTFEAAIEMAVQMEDQGFRHYLAAIRTVRTMKRGDFQITPKECEFCDFGSVCRYVEVGVREDAE